MKSDNVLRLLIINDSVEEAEHVVSVLRNAGFAVRPQRVSDSEELGAALERHILDMVLFDPNVGELGIETVTDAIDSSGKDLPLLVLATQADTDLTTAAINNGARDLVLRSVPDHLQFVVRREMDNLHIRRRLRQIEGSLRETEKRCHSLLDSSRDAIAYVHEGMHVYANQAYLELFQFDDFEQIEGLPLLDMVASDNHAKLKELLKQLSRGETPDEGLPVTGQRPDGAKFDVVMEFSSAAIEGEPCTQIVMRDQSVTPEMAKELNDLKTKDLVTGLSSRQHFGEELEKATREAAQQEGGTTSLMVLELDNFRATITQVGIGGSDLILADVAKLLRDQIGENDNAARLADHTLAVLCRDRSTAEAAKLAEQIRKSVEDHLYEVGSQSVNMTCSIGLTAITENSGNPTDLLSLVGGEAQRAQADGGNVVRAYDPRERRKDGDKDSHWVNLIRDALDNDGLLLVFQPIVSLHGAEGEYYETLVRLKGKGGEPIAPQHFLPAAERNGMMPAIDRWVVGAAIRVLKERQADAVSTHLFVKITPPTIADQTFIKWLAGELRANRIPGERLIFEMPESTVVTNIKPARQFQAGLRQLHCGFALVQFGSGLNSFQLLKHLPADYLKIDRSYMADLPKSEENQQKIKEISDQAHALGKITIAEFVEDAASMSVLWQCGVNFVQGNFLQEPEKVLEYDFSG
ncbi:MAG: GGDEF-domain containing protein [Lysobacteraceae bacterium]|nr:MAG: GGDEF-domain containing protein [Xanthomonadaceae bacterium]